MKNALYLKGLRLWVQGLLLLALRWAQLKNGFDPETGLSRQSVPGIVLAAAILLLAAAEELLAGRGACRIHGGGFAGTIQAFVPLDRTEAFTRGMEALAGAGACHVLSIRSTGAAVLLP